MPIIIIVVVIFMLNSHRVTGQGILKQNHVLCHDKDRNALSAFRQGIEDPHKSLSSWSTEQDCCNWLGVECNNITGRVTMLELSSCSEFKCFLGGEIDMASLFELEFLNHLYLSFNDFTTIRFPPLQTSQNSSSPTNSSSLVYLDLAYNYNLHMDDLRWLSHVPSLEYLRLDGVSIIHETIWLQQISMFLPSLLELHLSNCFLVGTGINPSLGRVNFTSLTVLDLSYNFLDSEIFDEWFFNLSSSTISYIDLSFSHLRGQIPQTMMHFQTLGNLSSLTLLAVGKNQLSGSLPREFWKLSTLEYLSIGYNSFSGNLSEQNFNGLPNLQILMVEATAFNFQFGVSWKPPFQLQELRMPNCKIGPKFPSWLHTQASLFYLDMSSSGLSFYANQDFWLFVQGVNSANFYNNSITGEISASQWILNGAINLKVNNLTGELPRLSPHVLFFSIADNNLSGPISPNLCDNMVNESELIHLDLSNNTFSGEFPDCWSLFKSLSHLSLGGNKLTGKIPDSIGSLTELQTLRLHNNNLSGNVPPSLKNCTQLWFLDLGYNEFSGNIPTWITQLNMILLLRSNKFSGSIPLQICELSSLIVLDLADFLALNLSHNHLKGVIPSDIGHMRFLESLDLSNNQLSGEIPQSLSNLSFLGYLNLSYNDSKGMIPLSTQLQSFDLSSYMGNPELCGAPLLKNCTQEKDHNDSQQNEDRDSDEFRTSFLIGMGVGFASGFWVVCSTIFFIRRCRHAYFRMLDNLYVFVVLKMNRIL
ncbi:hypothetical protein PIB30_054777 [Stylosanthes scabra]|uniref:Leucine-rich repeat-containing N-terminal plant-type domain-containing protein n=1 Tax=Stylosanthes scabra TaxID=79078 RepID=A0ABU6QJK9_9FABA|nr:hypothetical protein [Stylosanthes scabra]